MGLIDRIGRKIAGAAVKSSDGLSKRAAKASKKIASETAEKVATKTVDEAAEAAAKTMDEVAEAINTGVLSKVDVEQLEQAASAKPKNLYGYANRRAAQQKLEIYNNYNKFSGAIDSGDLDKEALRNISGATGLKANDIATMAESNPEELKDLLRAGYEKSFNDINTDISMIDRIKYYRVPQKAVTVGVGAYIVQNMSDSRGQMSNGELYGQRQPYGGGT